MVGGQHVIMHNSVSLDGCITGFEPNMNLHYRIVSAFRADAYMAGSNTAITGIEQFGEVPPETDADWRKPDKDKGLSYWVIPDSKGSLKGKLHVLRRYEYCKDVIILVSERTSRDYLGYLKERSYDYVVCGNEFVDFRSACESLRTTFDVGKILVDSGPTLSGVLLRQQLVDKISLLVHPDLVGGGCRSVFESLKSSALNLRLALEQQEALESNYLWMVWRVVRGNQPAPGGEPSCMPSRAGIDRVSHL